MRIDVRSEVVRNNLELLKTLVRKSQSKETQAFVEMSTGCLIKLNPETPAPKNWKVIWIIWDGDENQIKVRGNEGLKTEAEQILLESVRTINKLFQRELQDVDDLLRVEFISPSEELFESVSHGNLSREGAEKLLKNRSVGTYLFRIDPFASILEEELSLRFSESVRCFTISVVAEVNTIHDYTVVEKLGTFQIYDDDPSLEQPCFEDVQAVLKTLKCTIPLKRS